mmetsp:Transcript_27797/g.59437  ORF Transcript_27797/g.59437 Transcript_27797/m.59437 type:complete len:200 (+) Transcript_27797:194-793(+)
MDRPRELPATGLERHRKPEPVFLGHRHEHAPEAADLLAGTSIQRKTHQRVAGHRRTGPGNHRVHRHHQLLRCRGPVHARRRGAVGECRQVRPELRPVLFSLCSPAGHDVRNGCHPRVSGNARLCGSRRNLRRGRCLCRVRGRRRPLEDGTRGSLEPTNLSQGNGLHAGGSHRPGRADCYVCSAAQLSQWRGNSPDWPRR